MYFVISIIAKSSLKKSMTFDGDKVTAYYINGTRAFVSFTKFL